MKKIVINHSYGGFNLSHAGMMRYFELKGVPLYVFSLDYYTEDKGIGISYVTGYDQRYSSHIYSTKPLTPEGNVQDGSVVHTFNFERDDPLLVRVVEELGTLASGHLSSLGVVEIPDDVDWQIGEYDGSEWVEEKHRRWE